MLQALPIPPQQVLPITPGPALVPLQALHVTPLSPREEAFTEALRDANDAVRTVLKYYGAQSADRTARARRAGSTPKQKIASEHAEWIEVWLAEMEYRLQLGIRPSKGHIDKIVADRFRKDPVTIKRARLEAGYT